MTGPTPKEPLHPLHVPAPDLSTEADAKDTSKGLNATRAHSRSGGEEDDDFLPVEELLRNIGEAQEWQQTGSTDKHVTGGSDGNFEYTAEGDRNSAASPRSSEDEHKEKSVAVGDSLVEDRNTQEAQREAGGSIGVNTNDDLTADRGDEKRQVVRLDKSIMAYGTDSDDSDAYTALRNKPTPIFRHPSILRPKARNIRASSTRKEPGSPGDPIIVQDEDTDSSGDGTSEERVGSHVSLRTSPTSVGGSEARYLTLHEKSKHDTPNTSPPHRNTLSSTPGKQTCGSNGGNRESLTPDPSTGWDKKDQCDDKEADTYADDEEEPDGDNIKNQTPSLRSTEKRSLSTAGEKPQVKRRIKRDRFSSRLSSDEETEMGDESDSSTYTPSKPHPIATPQSTPSYSTGLEGDLSDDGVMGFVGGRSRTAVIYEQQGWEGEIIKERNAKQGRGSPRKQYLVRWKPSWMDGGRLTAPGLVQDWKERKGSRK